jgi:hypothetical protein
MRVGSWVAALWVAMALIGYGIALQRYGDEQKTVSRTEAGQIEVHSGHVASLKTSWIRSRGAQLHLEGDDRVYLLPGEFVPNEGRWQEIEKLVQTGANVWFKNTAETGTILELQLNPGTPFLKILVNWDASMGMVTHMSDGYARTGVFFLVLGILVVPLFLGARRLSSRLPFKRRV